MRFGPVEEEDDGLAIGCVITTEFGKLPSSLGKIRVKSKGNMHTPITIRST